jgi:hypothetical protein
MQDMDFFYKKGELEVCTLVKEPTNKFTRLGSYVYGIVSFDDGQVRVPGRLTDRLLTNKEINIAELEGKEVVPRFRRRYAVEQSDVIPTIALAFTLAEEYYPHQEHQVAKPQKEYERPGIVGYGVYTSRFRIKEGAVERSVPFIDEDSITAAVEAGKMAIIHSGIDPLMVAKVYVGSESNPYAVKPIASKVAQVLKLGEEDKERGVQTVDAVDTEFACKAATCMFKDASALATIPVHVDITLWLLAPIIRKLRLETNQEANLTFFVGYGASAFIFGMNDVIAEMEDWCSCTSDTPDFWRRDQESYPRHGGRFTGEPAYFKHVTKAAEKLMEKMKLLQIDESFAKRYVNEGFSGGEKKRTENCLRFITAAVMIWWKR